MIHKNWTLLALVLLLLLSVLTGCANVVDQDQVNHAAADQPILQADTVLGQTFVARHAGLNGIDLWLEPVRAEGALTLHLRADAAAETDLLTATLPLAQVTRPDFYHLAFAEQWDSHSRYYYAFVAAPNGEIRLGRDADAAYLDGTPHQNHQPGEGQLAFRLTYTPWGIAWGIAVALAQSAGMIAMAALLYGVPGWALVVLMQRRWGALVEHWAEGVGVAAGLGMALYPLLLLWTSLVGLRLGWGHAWLPVGVSAGVLLWAYRPWQRREELRAAFQAWRTSEAFWPDVAFVGVALLVGIARFMAVRGLELPLWGDSIQHTEITQRLLETGGLFQSWQPYAPYRTFSQQFGFHALAAAWAWLSGTDAPRAVLEAGQAINWLAVIALYPLAYRLQGKWGGVSAVLVGGLCAQFPAYYTNWGRYPQMAGQAMLAAAVWWLWVARASSAKPAHGILGGGMMVASVVLAYYRMAFNYGAFALAGALMLLKPAQTGATVSGVNRAYWRALLGIGIVGGLLAAPWFVQLALRPRVAAIWDSPVAAPQVGGDVWMALKQASITWSVPQAAWIAVGLLLAVWLGADAALPVIWAWVLTGLPLLRMFPLPGVSLIQTFTLTTGMYIPQSMVWAVGGGAGLTWLGKRRHWAAVGCLLALGAGVYQVPAALRVLERRFDYTRPDIRAAQWIKMNLSEEAFFLINGSLYADGIVGSSGETSWWAAVVDRHAIGADGGAWLPILTRRGVTIPPQYAIQGEEPEIPGYTDAVNNLVIRLFEVGATSAEGLTAICQFPYPISHVYVGQGILHGISTDRADRPMLPADELLQSPAFHLIYQQDRVLIFELNRAVCAAE